MIVDGRLDGLLLDTQIDVAGPVALEQGFAQARADGPIPLQRIHVALWDTAAQMALDVLEVLFLLTVDVAGQVEIEVVLFDFLDRNHAGELWNLKPPVEDIDDLMDVLGAEAVLGAVFYIARAGVDHEDAFAGVGILLVYHDDAGRDAGAVKEIGGQADDGLDVALANEIAADVGLGIAPEEDAVGQNASALAGALERADDVQQVGVVALLGGRRAEGLETVVRIVLQVDAGAPALVRKWRIGDDVVESLERASLRELGIGQRVARQDERCRVVVQVHVHAGQSAGGRVFFLPIEGGLGHCLIGHFEQERSRAACRVVDGSVRGRLGRADAENLRHNAADFGWGVELSFALAALCSEVPHEVLVGISKDVVTIGSVLGEVEGRFLKDGNEAGESVYHLLAAAEFGGFIEVREVREIVGFRQWGDDLLVNLIADIGLALELDHVLKARPRGNCDWGKLDSGVFVADVLDEKQDEDVVLVLAGIHAAAKFIATGPERAI